MDNHDGKIAEEVGVSEEEISDICEEINGEETMKYDIQMDILGEVNKILNELSEWMVGDYVAVMYGKNWFPGKIVALHEDASADISCMKYADRFQQDNIF